MTAIVLGFLLRGRQRNDFTRASIVFYISVIAWILVEMAVFSLRSPVAIKLMINLKQAAIAWNAVALLYMILEFYHRKNRLPLWAKVVVLGIPAATTVMAVLSPAFDFLTAGYTPVQTAPIVEALYTGTPWFFVNMAFCQVVISL